MKLYSPSNNYKLDKILHAGKIYKEEIKHEVVDFDVKVPKSFKDAYPNFSIPALECPNEEYLFGVNTILLYLARNEQLTPWEEAKVVELLQKLQRDIESPTGILVLQQKQIATISEEQLQKAKQMLTKYAQQINEKLTLSSFLVGHRVTLADISVYCNLKQVERSIEGWEKWKHVSRWMNYMKSIVESE